MVVVRALATGAFPETGEDWAARAGSRQTIRAAERWSLAISLLVEQDAESSVFLANGGVAGRVELGVPGQFQSRLATFERHASRRNTAIGDQTFYCSEPPPFAGDGGAGDCLLRVDPVPFLAAALG